MSGVFVHQFELGPWDNFIYFVGCKSTRQCAVIDPAWDLQFILDEAAAIDVEIAHVLCTHSHFDHIDQAAAILDATDAPVHMLGEEIDFSGYRCENLVRHRAGDSLTIGQSAELTFVHTPGHTPGSTCYRIRDGLVAGDTLFVDGCGRCDFVGGDPRVMFETLKRLRQQLPAETVVYPGHNYGQTATARLDAQLESNPYLRLGTVDEFVKHRMEGKQPDSPLPPKPTDWMAPKHA